jgi:hypothetical protein
MAALEKARRGRGRREFLQLRGVARRRAGTAVGVQFGHAAAIGRAQLVGTAVGPQAELLVERQEIGSLPHAYPCVQPSAAQCIRATEEPVPIRFASAITRT